MLDISLCVSHNGFSAAFFFFLDVWFSSSSFVFSSMIYIMFLYFYLPLFVVLFFVFVYGGDDDESWSFGQRFCDLLFLLGCLFVLFFSLRNLC